MKSLKYTALVVFLLVLVGGGAIVVRQHQAVKTEQDPPPYRACPLSLYVNDAPAALPPDPRDTGLVAPLAGWQIMQWRGEGFGPKVTVGHDTIPGPDDTPVPACILTVTEVPTPPFDGIDWRFGYRMTLPDSLRASLETAVLTMDVMADTQVEMSGGSVYIFDGARPIVEQLEELEADWKPIRITMPLSENVGFIEIWYRLALHGPISGPVRLSYAAPTLRLTTGTPAPATGESR